MLSYYAGMAIAVLHLECLQIIRSTEMVDRWVGCHARVREDGVV